MSVEVTAIAAASPAARLGFLGVGWIGRDRMEAVCGAGHAQAVAVADPDPAAREAATEALPGLVAVAGLDELLTCELDGIVIATPSALHAQQATAALRRGIAVFCQKPLARDAAEARLVVDAARRADRRLGVDLSYRWLMATRWARAAIDAGELGDVFAVDLTFHNAYGPDKQWCSDRRLAGGGCLIDLGTHLVDLALWLTGGHTVEVRAAQVLQGGRPLDRWAKPDAVEDFAMAHLIIDDRIAVRVACSWWEPVGADCEIAVTIRGSEAAVQIANVNGSFLDFSAHRLRSRERELMSAPPDKWGSRALAAWALALVTDPGYDPAIEDTITVAAALDATYALATAEVVR
ncbi:MAG TPA: Gfo/Idh/MocA family oxidoreductase [Solirubrobacteraceae bacterium]|jgi:predicted dehydrogenase|nr:Gfo/Idh/MocA family oxidoreductase [Solirubrobacteraceae bacterium]